MAALIRESLRGIRNAPGVSLVIVLVLGTALAGVVSLTALADSVFFRPPPGLRNPQTLVALYAATEARPDHRGGFTWLDYLDVKSGQDAVSPIAAESSLELALTTTTLTERIYGMAVSAEYFDVLGVRPFLGRLLMPGDSFQPVVVLDYGLWRNRFGGDPGIIGDSVQLNGMSFTVSGVAPPGFRGPRRGSSTQVWLPLETYEQVGAGLLASFRGKRDREQTWLRLYGRRAETVSLEQVQAALDVVDGRLNLDLADHSQLFVAAPLLGERRVGSGLSTGERYLALLGLGALLVLVAAWANVGGLLLSSVLRRRRDLGVRLCLGERPRTLAATLLGESLILSALGLGIGLVLAVASRQLQRSVGLGGLQEFEPMLSSRVLAAAIAITVIGAISFGGLPAWRAARSDPQILLSSAPPVGGRLRLTVRELLVVLQVSVCFLVLVTAVLTQATRHALRSIPLGFEPDRVLVASIDVSPHGWPPTRITEFYDEVAARLRSLPGVESASVASGLRLAGSVMQASLTFEIVGRESAPETPPGASHALIGDDYFATIGTSLARGRLFSERDTASSTPILVINETAAREYWPAIDPLGQRVLLVNSPDPFEIVGIVADARLQSLVEDPAPIFFLYHRQAERSFIGNLLAPAMALLVRSDDDPRALLPALQRTVRELDPLLPIYEVATLDARVGDQISRERHAATLFTLFAVLAVVLMVVGLFAVLARAVMERTREVGVRVACGATPGQVRTLVWRRALGLVLAGILVGALAAQPATRLIESQLYGVQLADLWVWALPALLLVTIAAFTASAPARRAASLDPVRALRWE